MVRVRYWAGVRAAAQVESDQVSAGSLQEVVDAVVALRPGVAALIPHCALMVDGRRMNPADQVPDDAELEILPPFAGG